jgi:predicted CoA-substrate-specific enzyme activase
LRKTSFYLGVDVGSVSTNLVIVDENDEVVEKLYLRTSGQPINVLRNGMMEIAARIGKNTVIKGVGTTGSGRQLASVMVGADIVKNEITTHAIAAQKLVPQVRTIMEIGGQDSKIIILKNGIIYDFAMNTVCAAGTGSFLDRQAARLDIPIEEFGGYALQSKAPVRIAGRCAVFAESDMIHKQQTGHSAEDIINGLCEALVRNYLNNLAKGKDMEEPIVFQGGVAANVGIVAAFEKATDKKIIIPKYYDVMGAYGAALIAKEKVSKGNQTTSFYGFGAAENEYKATSVECNDCSNLCEVIEITSNGKVLARWGDRCGKWSDIKRENESAG